MNEVLVFDIYCSSVSLSNIHHRSHGKQEVEEVVEELHDDDHGGRHPPRGQMEPCGNPSARAGQKVLNMWICIPVQFSAMSSILSNLSQ